jgi:hypothetical protein
MPGAVRDPAPAVHRGDQAVPAFALLKSLDLTVYKHAMVDYLPYPHMIYAGWKAALLS